MNRMPANKPPRAGSLFPLRFHHDPMYALGSSAVHLMVLLLTYSADHELDGCIPVQQFRALAAQTDAPTRAIEKLQTAGFIDVAEDFATIPGSVYGEFNLWSADVQLLKEKKRAAGRKGGASRAENAERDELGRLLPRQVSGDDQTDDWTNPDPSPVSRLPSLPSTRQPGSRNSGRTPTTRLPPFEELVGGKAS